MRYRPTSMLALVQKYKGVNRTREWVVDRVTELEGLKDDLLIDMIMRRIEDAPDKEHFQESVSVLMGDRANSFTNDMCAFLLNGKDPITNDPSSATAPYPPGSKAAGKQPIRYSPAQANTGPGTSAVPVHDDVAQQRQQLQKLQQQQQLQEQLLQEQLRAQEYEEGEEGEEEEDDESSGEEEYTDDEEDDELEYEGGRGNEYYLDRMAEEDSYDESDEEEKGAPYKRLGGHKGRQLQEEEEVRMGDDRFDRGEGAGDGYDEDEDGELSGDSVEYEEEEAGAGETARVAPHGARSDAYEHGRARRPVGRALPIGPIIPSADYFATCEQSSHAYLGSDPQLLPANLSPPLSSAPASVALGDGAEGTGLAPGEAPGEADVDDPQRAAASAGAGNDDRQKASGAKAWDAGAGEVGLAKADADATAAKAVAAMVAAHGMAGPPPARADAEAHEEDLLRRRLETMRLASLVTKDNTCDPSVYGGGGGGDGGGGGGGGVAGAHAVASGLLGSAAYAPAADSAKAVTQRLPQAAMAMGSAWGVAVCNAATCAVACDGIEQAYLPTPLSDPPMQESEIDQLREWLAEAARQLYGDVEQSDLVDRSAAVLRNSLLTSTVFAAFKEDEERAAAASAGDANSAAADAAVDTAKDAAKEGAGQKKWKLDLSALPSSLRSLLDERSLTFLLELWRVLRRDEPQTAAALLNPEGETSGEEGDEGDEEEGGAESAKEEAAGDTARGGGSGDRPTGDGWRALGGSQKRNVGSSSTTATTTSSSSGPARADPLSTARCDALGEALGKLVSPAKILAPPALAAEDGRTASPSGWDLRVVRAWLEKEVVKAQGFVDQILIDTVLRALAPLGRATCEGATCEGAACEGAAAGADNVTAILSPLDANLSPAAAAAAAAALTDPAGLAAHLDLLLDGGGRAFVASLVDFLNSAESHAPLAGASTPDGEGADGGGGGGGGGAAEGALWLPPDVERWCDPQLGLCTVVLLTEVREGVLMLLRQPAGRGCVLLQAPGARGLAPLRNVSSQQLSPLVNAWPAPNGALVQVGSRLVLLDGSGSMSEVTKLPPRCCDIDATWQERSGLTVVALFEPPGAWGGGGGGGARGGGGGAGGGAWMVGTAPARLLCWPPPKQAGRELRRFTMGSGWRTLGTLGVSACRLSVSTNGQRLGWCEPFAPPTGGLRGGGSVGGTTTFGMGGDASADANPATAVGSSAAASRLLTNSLPSGGGGGDGSAAADDLPAGFSWQHAHEQWRIATQCGIVREGASHCRVRAELYTSELTSRGMDPAPLTDGAGHCVCLSMAPDGSGVAYLASHSGAAGAASRLVGGAHDLSLWWQTWEGGAPPVQLCPGGVGHPYGRIVGFGWAPPAEDEELTYENEQGEEETEIIPGLRLWVTSVRGPDCRAHTQLVDLTAIILGAFELPIRRDAVVWLEDGRRVLVTESPEWFPSLWDGAALSALPLPSGFGEIAATMASWSGADGRRMPALSYALPTTPHDAPIVLHLVDVREEDPTLLCRGAIADEQRPVLALLKAGVRVIRIECEPSASQPRTRAHAANQSAALAADVVAGLDQYLAAAGFDTGLDGSGGATRSRLPQPPRVGVLGCGLGGTLALHAIALAPSHFAAAVCQGAPLSERWVQMETGETTPRSVEASLAGAALRGASDGKASADDSANEGGDVGKGKGKAGDGKTPKEKRAQRRSGEGGAQRTHTQADSRGIAEAAAAAAEAAAAEYEFVARLSFARAPTLLLYGDSDGRCPLSQAYAAYHALTGAVDTSTQLVIYPAEASAPLCCPAHQRDASRRVASWFMRHLRSPQHANRGTASGMQGSDRPAQPPPATRQLQQPR